MVRRRLQSHRHVIIPVYSTSRGIRTAVEAKYIQESPGEYADTVVDRFSTTAINEIIQYELICPYCIKRCGFHVTPYNIICFAEVS
jgi:hypothetical protein